MLKIYLSICLILLSTSCSVRKVYVQSFDGPPLSSDKVALVKPSGRVYIEAIDEKTSNAFTATGNIDTDIIFLPGYHTLLVGYNSGNERSRKPFYISFTIKAGDKFLLTSKVEYNTWSDNTWRIEMIDVTNDPEKWCYADSLCKSDASSKPESTGSAVPITYHKY